LSRRIKKLEDAELRKCQTKQRPSPPSSLEDAGTDASQRMRQYLCRNTWMDHVSNCFQVEIAQHKSSPEDDNGLKCAYLHSRCAVLFDSVLQLRFHYQDVHCVSFAKGTKRRLSDTKIEVDRSGHGGGPTGGASKYDPKHG
jgi:hypothetical protein